MSAQTLAVPTICTATIYRKYGAGDYARVSGVYGDKEAIQLYVSVMSSIWTPIVNIPVNVYLDTRKIATIHTDIVGTAQYLFAHGITQGEHVITVEWTGDFWSGPSSDDISLTTVAMTEIYFKSYVNSLAVPASALESAITVKLLNEQVGAITTNINLDVDRARYVLTVLVPDQPTTGSLSFLPIPALWAVAAVMVAIASVLLAAAVVICVTIVYVKGQYQCGICGEAFVTCESMRDHLIADHPDEWTQIQDNFECAPPENGFKWAIYGGLAIAGVIGTAYLIQTLKKK